MRRLELAEGWSVLQDVHDVGEFHQIYNVEPFDATQVGPGVSEWEPITRLVHLQLLFAPNPYWGRSLRHFNAAPWWYRLEFSADGPAPYSAALRFSNVDYFARVWLNGVLLGDHEGYGAAFSFDVSDALVSGRNVLVVKVWSPWDTSVADTTPEMRTLRVDRDMVKGTYEHDDTLVPRDVNPVGIYGTVELLLHDEVRIELTHVSAARDGEAGVITVHGVASAAGAELSLRVRDRRTGAVEACEPVGKVGPFEATLRVPEARSWATWDHGDQPLYDVEAIVGNEVAEARTVAFRTVELTRTTDRTSFAVNGVPLYIRGTSYLPDAYLSSLSRERYLRDLLAIRDAGCNTVRVHVHVEQDAFYDLCDELGLAVIQDTDYNWNHPADGAWRDRFLKVVGEVVHQLARHPSVIAWVALNEPGNSAPTAEARDRAMDISPGPQVLDLLHRIDPTRPVIKGSWCEDDLDSGDSHNYTGSLWGPDAPYTDIDGRVEKLNTEFGFDAPSTVGELSAHPAIAKRLARILHEVPVLQDYQYALIRYYIDQYRASRNQPNSGYVHFMFIDLAPQSFYGVVSHAGIPKRGYEALREANQPVAALLRRSRTEASAILLANDHPWELDRLWASWTVTDGDGEVVASGSRELIAPANSLTTIAPLEITARDHDGPVHVAIEVRNARGVTVARAVYRDLFGHPQHPEGHPHRMSHEFGVRLYGA